MTENSKEELIQKIMSLNKDEQFLFLLLLIKDIPAEKLKELLEEK